MNNLQRLRAEETYLVTLNRSEAIDPAKMLRRIQYDHPMYTAAGVAAQARHAEVSGVRRTHYCGAYWGWGFHEDGVVSALRACARIPGGSVATDVSELAGAMDPANSDTLAGELQETLAA
jgi:predicted NAD/FAD-binding protein